MRKTTAVIFLLLANIVLLVHAVVPHHHHHEQICFNLFADHAGDEASHSLPGDCSHQHGPEDNPGNCMLKQLVVVPAHHFRVEPLQATAVDLPDFFVSSAEFQYNIIGSDLFQVYLSPPNFFFDQTFPPSSSGLRAPPSV